MKKLIEIFGYLRKNEIYADKVFDMINEEIKQNNELKKFLTEDGKYFIREYLKEENIPNSENLSEDEIKQIISNLSTKQIIKIKMKLSNLITPEDNTYGPIENKKFFQKLLSDSILNKSEKKLLDVFDMTKENGNQVQFLNFIRFNLREGPIFYRYSEEKQIYELVSTEEALKLSKDYRDRTGRKLIEEKEH